MDNRQLQIFYHVASLCSFTKASKALHMAQPAVSIAVRKLEEELGVVLFNRADKKVELTYEGKALFIHAERILAQFQQARQELKELRDLATGEVRLGTSVMLGSYYFPEKIAEFRNLYPNINLQVIGEGTQRSQQLILDGSIDVGIVNMKSVTAEIEARPLLKEEVVACISPSHKLAKRSKIHFSDFIEENLIVYRKGHYLRELIEEQCRYYGVQPNIVVETDLLRLMMNLVQSCQGVSICLERVIEKEEGIVGVSFTKPIYLELGVAWKSNHYLSKANNAFVEYLLDGKC